MINIEDKSLEENKYVRVIKIKRKHFIRFGAEIPFNLERFLAETPFNKLFLIKHKKREGIFNKKEIIELSYGIVNNLNFSSLRLALLDKEKGERIISFVGRGGTPYAERDISYNKIISYQKEEDSPLNKINEIFEEIK